MLRIARCTVRSVRGPLTVAVPSQRSSGADSRTFAIRLIAASNRATWRNASGAVRLARPVKG